MRIRWGFAVISVFMLSACSGGDVSDLGTPPPPLVHSVPVHAGQDWVPVFSEPGSNIMLNMVQPGCNIADASCTSGPHKNEAMEVVCLDRLNPSVLGVVVGKNLKRQDAVAYWANAGDVPLGFVNIDQVTAEDQGKLTKGKFAELSGTSADQVTCSNGDGLAHNDSVHLSHLK